MSNESSGNRGRSNWNRGDRGGYRREFGGNRGSWRGGSNRGSYGGRGAYRDGLGYRNNQQWRKREMPRKRLTEHAIGVTKYVSDHEGFTGIIKARYSDFQVSEINEKGEVAKLTDFKPPEPPTEETVDEDEDLLLSKYNLEILPMETWDSINKLIVSKDASSDNVEVIDATNMSKEQRTKIHDAVKKAFGDAIVGSTVNDGDKKMLRFQKYRKGVRIDNRVKWIWPGEFVYFIVNKVNCDTMEAAARIAERLRLNLKPSMVGYAGSKDRRAVTSQWFSLRKVDPRHVAESCRCLKDVKVGNFSFSNQCLKLGMLKGNKFRIALRNVTVPDETVDAACRLLQEKGFINYYGLQRFGTRVENPTYDIGMKLLQGNFKAAINSILEESSGDLQEALQRYRARGPAAALEALPRSAGKHVEARLLRALAKAPNDLLGALSKLPRNTRLLYLHAYQSLIWNRAATERITRCGLAPAPGDLVPGDQLTVEEEMYDVGSDEEEINESETDVDGADTEKQSDAADSTTDEKREKDKHIDEKPKIPVKVLTKEDVESGQYTVFDIILPLPGYRIEYPPNMKDFYEELMSKDGLTLELRHKIKSYNMSGAYRHLTVRPVDVSWRCVRYSQPSADLIRSDLDEARGRELSGIEEDGKYKAMLLTMSLPASSYATMALRELLKVDTACDNQALQNNYYKQKNSDKSEGTPKTDDQSSEKEEKGVIEGDKETENGVKRKLDQEECDDDDLKKLKTGDE